MVIPRHPVYKKPKLKFEKFILVHKEISDCYTMHITNNMGKFYIKLLNT